MAGIQGQNQLTDFLRALKRRRWQVFVPASLVITVGVAYAVIVPKKYRLSTRVEIGSEAPLFDARRNAPEIPERREAQAVNEHIRHHARVKEVIERELVLHLWPEYELLSDAEKSSFIKEITDKNLQANPTNRDIKSGTIFVDISYSDESPERAERFLTDLTESWLDYVAQSDRETLLEEKAKLQEIVDGLNKELRDKENRLASLGLTLEKDPSDPGTDSRREVRGDWTFVELEEARTELGQTELKLKGATLEYEQAQVHWEGEPEDLETLESLPGKDPSEELAELRAELEKLEEEIEGKLPAYSKYQKLTEKIVKLKLEIEELENADPGSTETTKRAPNPRKDEYLVAMRQKKDQVDLLENQRKLLEERIAELSKKTQEKTESYKEYRALQNEADEARKAYNETRSEWLQRDKALQMLDASPRRWRIAQRPLQNSPTVTPNPYLIVAFSVFAGLALGMGLAIFSEYAKSSYRSVGDLAAVMSVPVLGAIETIVTRRELRRVQVSRAIAGLSTAMIVGSIGWVTWLWATAPERLPIEVQDAIESLRTALK